MDEKKESSAAPIVLFPWPLHCKTGYFLRNASYIGQTSFQVLGFLLMMREIY
jgi:hypothetical protein